MRWGAALMLASWLTLGHGPAAAQSASCIDIGEGSLPLWLRVNAQLLDLVCSTSIGFSHPDPFCELLSSGEEQRLLAREILAGGEGASFALMGLTSHPGPFPFVPLAADPGDAACDESAASVSLVLSDEQQALLGCGAFHGTSCEDDGIDLLNAEASALLQSFQFFDGPVCARSIDGELAILPGCRAPGPGAYDPAIDGTPPPQPHPIDGSAFSTEMAALSWNFLVYLVASSDSAPEDPDGPDGSGFDPGHPYAPDRCSFANPGLCSAVRSVAGAEAHLSLARVQGRKLGRDRFTLEVWHPGIALQGNPATLGASLVVSSLDPAGGSTGTIELDPRKWKLLRSNGEVVGYRYRDRARSRGGVSKIVLRDGHLEIHAWGRSWSRKALRTPREVWVHFSVGADGWCGTFVDDAGR